jgi:thioredoxin reductase (NADPH)
MMVENYPGFVGSGGDLMKMARKQYLGFGGEIVFRKVTNHADLGVKHRTLVIASGVDYREIQCPRNSVMYSATELEAERCRDKDIVVIGMGNSASQAVVFLSKYARSVTLIHPNPDINHAKSTYMVEKLQQVKNLKIRFQDSLHHMGNNGLYMDSGDVIEAECTFCFIGMRPRSSWLPEDWVDVEGYVLPDKLPSNVFAAGDIVQGSQKSVANAVGTGSAVVSKIHAVLR